MRFSVAIELNRDKIPKDYARSFLSLVKFWLNKTNPAVYQKLYGTEESIRKNFTFSVYLGKCRFLRDEIELSEKCVQLTVSSYDTELGIHIYNALLSGKNMPYVYKDITYTVKGISVQQERLMTGDETYFRTISSIVVREHSKETNKDWFHSLSEEKGKRLFLDHLKIQLLDVFPEAKNDIEDVKIEILENKEVKVKHYGIEVLSNICKFKMKAKPYISEYLYKAGAGSMKSTGFGMLTTV